MLAKARLAWDLAPAIMAGYQSRPNSQLQRAGPQLVSLPHVPDIRQHENKREGD